MRYGYVRVSTKEQNENSQIAELKKYGVADRDIFTDKMTGKSKAIDRPSFKELLVKCVKGDTIVINEFDRLGRNLEDIKATYELLSNKGIFIKVISQDMLSTEGKSELELKLIIPILVQMMGYMAEMELKNKKERVRRGLEAMATDKITGKKIGRSGKATGRPKLELTSIQENCIKAWLDKSNKTYKLADCISDTGLGRATLYRIKADRK